MEHTPGPWQVQKQDRDTFLILGPNVDKGKAHSCYTGAYIQVARNDYEPDAYLIAAAPTMLDAVKMARGFVQMFNDGTSWTDEAKSYARTLARNLDNAIAKAEGR